NAWDFPTFLGLSLLAVLVASGFRWRRAIVPLLVFVLAALLAWSPFLAAYTPPTTKSLTGALGSLPLLSTVAATVGIHPGERTSLVAYLTIFGVPYAVALVFLASGWRGGEPEGRDRPLPALGIAAVATVIPGVLLAAPVIPLCGIPLALAISE